MNLTIEFDAKEFEAELQGRLDSTIIRGEDAMADTMRDIVDRNFGFPPGLDRPQPWADLSDRSAIGRAYILKVNRTFATLYVTGAMAAAVRTTPSTGTGARVSLSDADCPYATKHHFGDPSHNLPIRRVFPINLDGSITEYSMNAVLETAFHEIQEALR